MKNNFRPLFLLHLTLQLALCIGAGSVVLASAKPRFVHRTARWRGVIHSKCVSTAQSPMGGSFTQLKPTFGTAHGDVRLGCGCSSMETQFMKLPTKSYCADVTPRGSLELGSECCNLRKEAGACVAYHFAAEPLLLYIFFIEPFFN